MREQLAGCAAPLRRGAEIAVAVGSRGIANIAAITKAVVSHLIGIGATPFIVPAMGSHGGATAEGQAAILAGYGITAETMGCSVRSSMDVIELEKDSLFMDRHAWESDGVVLINRIKPHTDFHGRYESGLAKMAVIGLGKERQALANHAFGIPGLRDMIPSMAEQIFATGKIMIGVGIVENEYDETALIEVLPAPAILSREPELLEVAKRNMPRLPVDELDVLIVDRLGKNISGTGMDTNIIGRIRIADQPEPSAPLIRSILVTDLTPQTHGNATGMGLADVVTRRFANKIDFKTTYKNIVTSGFFERGKLPIVAENDREGLEMALRGAGGKRIEEAAVIRIKDTLHVDELFISPALIASLKKRENIEILNEQEMFNFTGDLAEY